MRAQVSQLPTHNGDGYGYGGGFTVSCPQIIRHRAGGKEATRQMVCLMVGEGKFAGLTAEFLADAINEKLDREFVNGGG